MIRPNLSFLPQYLGRTPLRLAFEQNKRTFIRTMLKGNLEVIDVRGDLYFL